MEQRQCHEVRVTVTRGATMQASEHLPAQFNVATWFVDRHVTEGRGGAPAFHYETRVLTYGDVFDLANRTGNALRALGVGLEDRVLVLCLDAPEFLATFWGAIKIGAVPIPVNTLMRATDYLYFLNDSRAKVAVVSAPLLAEAGPILGQAPLLRHVLVAGGAAAGYLSFEEQVSKAGATLDAAPTSRDDPAFWLYSSGSTGFPKGAVHLQHDMWVCAETYARQVLGITASDKVFSAAKLFFAYGLGNAGYFPMAVGAQAVLYPHRPTPEGVFEVLTRHRPTIFFGVPTLYAGMLAVKEAEKRFDLSSLRVCVSAGAARPAEVYPRGDGYFGSAGRADDMLKVGGIWVSPVEVEATLIKPPAVLEVAVVGKEDSDRLVKPQAFVVLKEPAGATAALADELKGFVRDKIAPYKYPRWIEFVSDLPKTATGKIQRFKLRAR